MLHRGEPLAAVLASAFGGCMDGIRWQYAVAHVLSHGELATGLLATTPLRHHEATDRESLAVLLEVLGHLRRKGSRILAQGPEVWLGTVARRLGMSVHAVQNRLRVMRQPIPHGGKHGDERPLFSSRTIETKRGPRRTAQPRPSSPDAMAPQHGEFSYLEHEPDTQLPASVWQRLRAQWAAVQRAAAAAVSSRPANPRMPAPPQAAPVVPAAPRGGAPPPLEDVGSAAAEILAHLKTFTPSWRKR